MSAQATRWLAEFEKAPREELFLPQAHWRDLFALTSRVQTLSGASNIVKHLPAGASRFELDPRRTPPRHVTRAGRNVLEALFGFETAAMRGQGVLRLVRDGDTWKCWTLLTAADELKGFEEHTGSRRPRGESYSRDFRGPNWLDLRRQSTAYADRDPAVLVVGAGQAGLCIGARLKQLDVDTLIVDRHARIGDNWRRRYHALTLHNQVQVNHLPYLPFPPNWPTYIPKDKLANWFEAYAEAMELDVWTETEFTGTTYDEQSGSWTTTLMRDGTRRTLRSRHIVMATGISGIPKMPDIPSLKDFAGTVVHSHDYQDATPWKGRHALVIGTGNSGHDIAQDLYANGAHVTLVQRNPTLITNIEPSAQLAYALYSEGLPTEECDLIAAGTPLCVQREAHRIMNAQSQQLDKPLLDALARVGFRLDLEDPTGWQFKYLTRGGGYYFNVGCSELLIERKIGLIQYADIERFVAEGARCRAGELIPADLVVLATGYLGLEHLVRQLFGDAVAGRVGPIWGIDEQQQELRNMWTATGQPGLWFLAGSFAQCRIYSKYLALQIKAQDEGLIPAPAAKVSQRAASSGWPA